MSIIVLIIKYSSFCSSGQPGDLIAAKTELKITQRLRLDQHKLEDLERKLRTSVTNALTITGNPPQINVNGSLSNGSTSASSRKQLSAANQTKFAILIATPKIQNSKELTNPTKQGIPNGGIKNEISSPHPSNENGELLQVKKERTEADGDNSDDDDETLLSRLISYLAE